MNRQILKYSLTVMLFGLLYFAAGRLGLLVQQFQGITPLWPPSGVALAALLILGTRFWPGIVIGIFLLGFTLNLPLGATVSGALAQVSEALLAAYILGRMTRFRMALTRFRDILELTILAMGPATMLSATIGVTGFFLAGLNSAPEYLASWLIWWAGDAIGIVVLTPLLLVMWQRLVIERPHVFSLNRWHVVELIVLLTTGILAAWIGLGLRGLPALTSASLAYLPMPFIIWAALRFRMPGAAVGNTLLAVLALVAGAQETGPFSASTNIETMTLQVILIGVMSITGLTVAAIFNERDATQVELQESERRLANIITLAMDAIVATDESKRIILFNAAAEQMFRCSAEEAVGEPVTRFISADELELQLSVFRETGGVRRRPGIIPPVITGLRSNGETFPVEASLSEIRASGHTYCTLILRDITERKAAEEMLRQSQKIESLGLLAGGIAHDFNNLLVAMLGQTSLALRKLDPRNPAQPHIEKASKAAERASGLTQQLLAYSGRGRFVMAPLDLNSLIEENMHLLQVAIPRNVTLKAKLAGALPLIEADASQMQQVVMNLILNAAEAIGVLPGTVVLTTTSQWIDVTEDSPRHYYGAQLFSGQYVTLEVQDNGQGMDERTLSKIFDPFFSTKATGHGLGLAAVLGIVRGHQSGLLVFSEPGQGTTFRLLFPALENVEGQSRANDAQSEEGQTPGISVLIIDDEAFVRDAAADILHLKGIEVIAASDGKTGAELYRQRQADIDLVLLDLSMPGWTGEETLRSLREINPEVQVILSSGYSAQEAIRYLVDQPAAGFLQKPYDAAQLLQAIEEQL